MLKNKHHPNTFVPTASPELSYVLGVIQGDGSVYKTTQKYKNRKAKKVHFVHLSVRDQGFAEEFATALSIIFNKPVKVIRCDEQKGRGIFYKVFLASKDFYRWFYSTNTFRWGIQFPDKFVKGFFDSDGSFNYFASKGYKYPVVRMVGSDTHFLKRLQRVLESEYGMRSILKNRGVPKPTVLNNTPAIWKKEVYELGVFNKKDVTKFLNIVQGSNKLKKMEE